VLGKDCSSLRTNLEDPSIEKPRHSKLSRSFLYWCDCFQSSITSWSQIMATFPQGAPFRRLRSFTWRAAPPPLLISSTGRFSSRAFLLSSPRRGLLTKKSRGGYPLQASRSKRLVLLWFRHIATTEKVCCCLLRNASPELRAVWKSALSLLDFDDCLENSLRASVENTSLRTLSLTTPFKVSPCEAVAVFLLLLISV